jgi:hypothetical protein
MSCIFWYGEQRYVSLFFYYDNYLLLLSCIKEKLMMSIYINVYSLYKFVLTYLNNNTSCVLKNFPYAHICVIPFLNWVSRLPTSAIFSNYQMDPDMADHPAAQRKVGIVQTPRK